MKKLPIFLFILLSGIKIFGQSAENQALINLGKAYKDYHETA